MEHLYARLDALRQKLTDEAFLENRGLSNEVGLYIFRYPPQEEMAVRAFMQGLCREMDGSAGKCRILFFDLYEILLGICRNRRILERIPQMEAQRGGAFTLAQIQKLAPPEAYVQRMQYPDHRPGDVVMIAGVGRVFPYMRSHHVLNNLQHLFDDVPVVMLYPGQYNGQTLTLFERFTDDNYYRAFNLI